jgi:hypothetical protein
MDDPSLDQRRGPNSAVPSRTIVLPPRSPSRSRRSFPSTAPGDAPPPPARQRRAAHASGRTPGAPHSLGDGRRSTSIRPPDSRAARASRGAAAPGDPARCLLGRLPLTLT